MMEKGKIPSFSSSSLSSSSKSNSDSRSSYSTFSSSSLKSGAKADQFCYDGLKNSLFNVGCSRKYLSTLLIGLVTSADSTSRFRFGCGRSTWRVHSTHGVPTRNSKHSASLTHKREYENILYQRCRCAQQHRAMMWTPRI